MIKQRIVQAVLDEPELVGTIKMPRITLLERLRLKSPEKRELYITGATPATMYKISALIGGLKTKSDKEGTSAKVYDIIHSNIGTLVKFVAIAIHNKKGDPPEWLLDALHHQFPIEKLKHIADIAYRRLGVEPFFGIMGLVREIDLLNDPQETEAHGQQSGEQSNISDSDMKK